MRGSDRLRDHRISDVSPFEKGHIGRRHTGTVWILILCRKLCSRNGILPEERQKRTFTVLTESAWTESYTTAMSAVHSVFSAWWHFMFWSGKEICLALKAKLLSVAGCGVTLVLFARITAPYLNNQSFVRKYMGMLVTFVKTNAKSVTFKGDHVSSGVILFGVVALILFLLILFLCQKKKGYQACALTLLVSVLLFGYNVTNITISESNTREARISSASNLILSFGDIYKEYSYVWTEKKQRHRSNRIRCV